MKIAIVGSSGYIAGYLIKKFKEDNNIEEILVIGRSEKADIFLDLNEPSKFDYKVLESIDYIIYTAAISGPDQCAKEYSTCWKVNVIGTQYFIEEAIKRNCNILFFSSDAVYGDSYHTIFTENSPTHATTAYGRMKKAIEDYFKSNLQFKSIRFSYVVSANDKFIKYCIACLEKNKVAEIFHPFYRNCIVVSDVVEIVNWLIKHWNEYEPKILNAAGSELISRIRIADEMNRLSGNKLHYTIVKPDDKFFENRPIYAQMKSIYINKLQILKNENFTEKIQKELENINL